MDLNIVLRLALLYFSDYNYSQRLPKYVPNRPLRSSTAGLLAVPKKMATKKHGEAAFCFYGPTAWNKLPLYLRQAGSVDIFKAQLKTYLYTIAFN